MTLLPIGKPRAVDSMVCCTEVDVLIVVSAYVEPWYIHYNVAIYKNAKMS